MQRLHLFLLTLQSVPYLCVLSVILGAIGRMHSTSIAYTVARMRPWSSIYSLCCRFIDTMQRTGINDDNYPSSEWGLLGPGLSKHFMRPFHSLCGVFCRCGRWHPERALITHGWESVTALCWLLWSAASTQSPGYNVLFMSNNQDLTSERVLKWNLWRVLGAAWKDFWKHLHKEKNKAHKITHTQKDVMVMLLSCLNYVWKKRSSCWLCNWAK